MKNLNKGIIGIGMVMQIIVLICIMTIIVGGSIYGFSRICSNTQTILKYQEYAEFGIYRGIYRINNSKFTGSSSINPDGGDYLVNTTVNIVPTGCTGTEDPPVYKYHKIISQVSKVSDPTTTVITTVYAKYYTPKYGSKDVIAIWNWSTEPVWE